LLDTIEVVVQNSMRNGKVLVLRLIGIEHNLYWWLGTAKNNGTL